MIVGVRPRARYCVIQQEIAMQPTLRAANRSKAHAITRGCLAGISFIFR
jgi:hypothetical protein